MGTVDLCCWGAKNDTRYMLLREAVCCSPKLPESAPSLPLLGGGHSAETTRIRGYDRTISTSLMMICILRGCSQPSNQQFQPSKGTGIYAVCCSVALLVFIIIVTINLFYHSCREKCGGASGAVALP